MIGNTLRLTANNLCFWSSQWQVQLVYNKYVQLVEVPIKPSDRLKARDMLRKYHKLFTERKEFTGDTPVIVNIGEWSEGDEEDTQRELDKIKENYPNRTIIVDDVPLEDWIEPIWKYSDGHFWF